VILTRAADGGELTARLLSDDELAEHHDSVSGAEAHLSEYRGILSGEANALLLRLQQPHQIHRLLPSPTPPLVAGFFMRGRMAGMSSAAMQFIYVTGMAVVLLYQFGLLVWLLLPTRFSLRSLLAAMTLVALILGLVAYLVRTYFPSAN
jgi:hypothetical protein